MGDKVGVERRPTGTSELQGGLRTRTVPGHLHKYAGRMTATAGPPSPWSNGTAISYRGQALMTPALSHARLHVCACVWTCVSVPVCMCLCVHVPMCACICVPVC